MNVRIYLLYVCLCRRALVCDGYVCVCVYEHALVLEWQSQWANESSLSHEAGCYSFMDALHINNLHRKRSPSVEYTF